MGYYFKIMTIYLLSSIGYSYSDINKCTEPIKHYKELGCHPAVEEGRHCPTRYLCPNITMFDPDRCHYKEKEYYVTQKLTDDKTTDQCVTRCTCSDIHPRGFKCKDIACPHTTGKIDPTKCVGQYNLGQCCPREYLCEEKEIEELAQCKYDGEIYLEGEKFYPEKEKCWSCICTKKFNATIPVIENPYCRETDCGIELRYFNELRRGCIPIYYEDRCCPTDWKCPDRSTDVSVQRNGYTKNSHKIFCSFGDLKIKIGDIVKTDDKCLKCVCGIPPLPHCMIDEDCVVEEESKH